MSVHDAHSFRKLHILEDKLFVFKIGVILTISNDFHSLQFTPIEIVNVRTANGKRLPSVIHLCKLESKTLLCFFFYV